MDLSLKGSQPLTPSALTFHSSTQSGIPPPTHSITLLSPSAFIPRLSEQPRRQKYTEDQKKRGKFQHQTLVRAGGCSQSQKGRVPPIGAQPEQSCILITTDLPPPSSHRHAGSRHPLTDSPYVSTHAQRISHFVCMSRPETCKVAQGCSALCHLRFSTGS